MFKTKRNLIFKLFDSTARLPFFQLFTFLLAFLCSQFILFSLLFSWPMNSRKLLQERFHFSRAGLLDMVSVSVPLNRAIFNSNSIFSLSIRCVSWSWKKKVLLRWKNFDFMLSIAAGSKLWTSIDDYQQVNYTFEVYETPKFSPFFS